MTLRRDAHGEFVVECDECGDELFTNTDGFPDAVEIAKGEGWRARKIEGEWEHRCSDCEF